MTTSEQVTSGNVWLIGPMASGKSTLGRALAGRLGWEYVDNDATVAELAGTSTLELSEQGADVLHDWESRYVHHLVDRSGSFVAGVAASSADRPEDLRILAGAGLLVVLDVDLDVLVERVHSDPPRPFMSGDVRGDLSARIARRTPALREHAGLVVDGARSVDELVDEVVRVLAGKPEVASDSRE
ncbi:shikimate kinase [Nocardioides sp.]|uniref:shikimate kinase n=1 Tax=Nocardioides sp. TaxID=35761 RepID=UPI002B267989|nr:shikimate kinase [Nocardioides sp.]